MPGTGLVPGLLQNENYARALFKTAVFQRSFQELTAQLQVRMTRQRRLFDEENPLE